MIVSKGAVDLRTTIVVPGRELTVELLPELLVRTPGFPAEWASRCADPSTVELAEIAMSCEDELAQRAADFDLALPDALERADQSEERQRRRRALRRAGALVDERAELGDRIVEKLTRAGLAEWAGGWETCIARYRERVAEFEVRHRTSTDAALLSVVSVFADPRLRHAVHTSNPSFYDRAERVWTTEHPDLSKSTRRIATTLHRYLRRFSTRCETVSFFGPVRWARLDPAAPTTLTTGPPGPERVHVDASAWLITEINRYLTTTTSPEHRRLRRSPVFVAESGCLVHVPSGRRFRATEAVLAVWGQADGRTACEIAAALAVPTADVLVAAERLGRAVQVSTVDLPSTELSALDRLAGFDPLIADLADAARNYARSDWPRRREAFDEARRAASAVVTGERRHHGGHYADREILHEDRTCGHSEGIAFGEPVVRGLTDALAAVLPLCYLAALLRRADARDAVRAQLGGRCAPLAALTAVELPASGPRERALVTRLVELFGAARPDGEGTLALDPARLHECLSDLWAAAEDDDPCLPSPDLMATGGDLSRTGWVLAELHDDCSSIYGGLENPLHSDPRGLWRGFSELIRDLVGDRAATVVGRRRSAHVTPELPGVSIELAGLSAKDRREVVPVAEVDVPASADGVLVAGRRRLLYPGDLTSPLHRALALPAVGPIPVDLGEHTPRLVLGRTVLQRARWRVDLGDLDPIAVHRARRAAGLPRRVFVRHPAEPKPLFVDFADPLAVAELGRLPAAPTVVTEMLPEPSDLWWSIDGPQCAELRLGALICPRTEGVVP